MNENFKEGALVKLRWACTAYRLSETMSDPSYIPGSKIKLAKRVKKGAIVMIVEPAIDHEAYWVDILMADGLVYKMDRSSLSLVELNEDRNLSENNSG